MIRRLIAYILIACLAAPAVAAPVHCVEQTPPAAMAHDHGQADHTQPAASEQKHDCIGCIVRFAPVMAPERPAPPRAILSQVETPFIALPVQRPETPPPRP